jgi:hypothetical protein
MREKINEKSNVTAGSASKPSSYIQTVVVGFALLFLFISETNAQKYLTSFGRLTNLKISGHYTKLLHGDFNGDGRSDIAAVSEQEVHLFYQSADGITFTEKSLRTSKTILAVAAGFINKDNITDIVTILGDPFSLVVYLGSTDGRFTVSWRRSLVEPSENILIADITNDHMPDIILYGRRELGATVYPGTGTGTFRQNITIFSDYSFTSLAVTKSNDDSFNDVVAANWISDQLLTYTAFGKLHFSDPTILPCAGSPKYIAAGLIDEDNRNDFIVGYSDIPICDVFIGDGAGGYSRSTTLQLSEQIDGLALQDVNGDGWKDILILSASTLFVRLNNGHGLFEEETPFDAGAASTDFTILPSRQSKFCNLAILDNGMNVIHLLHSANEHLLSDDAQVFAVGKKPTGVLSVDVNRDGYTDIIVANEDSRTISILPGTGSDTYQGQIAIRTPQAPSQIEYHSINDTLAVISSVCDNSNNISILEVHRKTFSSRMYTLPTQGHPEVIAVTHERNSSRFQIHALEYDRTTAMASVVKFEKISGNKFTQQVSVLNTGHSHFLDATYSSAGTAAVIYGAYDPNQKTETLYQLGNGQVSLVLPAKVVYSFQTNREVPLFIWSVRAPNDRQSDIIYYVGEPDHKILMLTAKNDTTFSQARLVTNASVDVKIKNDLQIFDCNSDGKIEIVFPDKMRKNLRTTSINGPSSVSHVIPAGQTIEHYTIARVKNESPCKIILTDSLHGTVTIRPIRIE